MSTSRGPNRKAWMEALLALRIIPYLAAAAIAVAVSHTAAAQYYQPMQPYPQVQQPYPQVQCQYCVPVQPYQAAPMSPYNPSYQYQHPIPPPLPPVTVVPFGAWGSTIR